MYFRGINKHMSAAGAPPLEPLVFTMSCTVHIYCIFFSFNSIEPFKFLQPRCKCYVIMSVHISHNHHTCHGNCPLQFNHFYTPLEYRPALLADRFLTISREVAIWTLTSTRNQSEHIGQCDTPHHLSDVRRGAPS